MRELITFVHIEKAAGTTLIHILRRNFLLRHCDVRPFFSRPPAKRWEPVFGPKDLKLVMRLNPFVRCISSHAITPATDFSGLASLRYITLLRNPIDRYISQFFYSREQRLKRWTFDRFLEVEENFNFQVRKIAGTSDVEKAKQTLSNHFLAVGLVEHFDEFLAFLHLALQPVHLQVAYRPANVRKHAHGLKKLKNKYEAAIIRRNRLDLELYRYVEQEILPKRKLRVKRLLECEPDLFSIYPTIRSRMAVSDAVDFLYRKLYLDPLTRVLRTRNGLPQSGSYAVTSTAKRKRDRWL